MFFHLEEVEVTEEGLRQLETRRARELADLMLLEDGPVRSQGKALAQYNDNVSWDMKTLLARPYDRGVIEEILAKSAIRDAERFGVEEPIKVRQILVRTMSRVSTPRLQQKLAATLNNHDRIRN